METLKKAEFINKNLSPFIYEFLHQSLDFDEAIPGNSIENLDEHLTFAHYLLASNSSDINEDLVKISKLLLPGSVFEIYLCCEQKLTQIEDFYSTISSKLILNGFTNVSEFQLMKDDNHLRIFKIITQKIKYEEGSGVRLNLSKIMNSSNDMNTEDINSKDDTPNDYQEIAKVWTLSASDMVSDDLNNLIDPDELLDSFDIAKTALPTQSQAVNCEPSAQKKKRACKDCTCGLAEKLVKEKDEKTGITAIQTQTNSSCGSCYLGDAFRCASCPYAGLPPFKPGEKVQITEKYLN